MDIFSAQSNKNQFLNKGPLSTPLPALPLSKSLKKAKNTQIESQTQTAQDLGKLLRLKTIQINQYGHILN